MVGEYLQDARAHTPDMVFHAQDLYVIEGLSLAAIATREDVPVHRSTLAAWSTKYGWEGMREKYRRAMSEVRLNEVLALEALIKSVVEKGNPMAAFGYSSLQGTRQKAREFALKERQASAQMREQDLPQITRLEDAVPILTEALQRKMAQILADPVQLNLVALRDLAKGFEFVGTLMSPDSQDASAKPLSPERAEEIRQEILGKA